MAYSWPVADVVERHLLLGLRLGRHVDGFVDAYYGPDELAARVDEEELASPEALVDDGRCSCTSAAPHPRKRKRTTSAVRSRGPTVPHSRCGSSPIRPGAPT